MKHAASVRPEPGSNSPLSEKLCPLYTPAVVFRPARIAHATRLRLTPATHTLELHFFVRITCELTSFSSSAILLSKCKADCSAFCLIDFHAIYKNFRLYFVKMTGILISSSCVSDASSTPGFTTDIFYHMTSILNVNMFFLNFFTKLKILFL